VIATALAFRTPVAAAAVLACVLGFLYHHTQAFDEAHYLRHVASLRLLKQLDAQAELDVMRSRMGLNPHYDTLTATAGELSRLAAVLGPALSDPHHLSSDGARRRVVAAVESKVERIEQFKSRNAILRNSVAFLPSAAADALAALAQQPVSQPAASLAAAGVNRLLLACLLYSEQPTAQRETELMDALVSLPSSDPGLSADARERLDLLYAHAATVMREQQSVDELLREMAASGTGSKIDELHDAVVAEQQHAAADARQYRHYLLLFAAILVALLLYAALHVVRGRRLIDRMNRELQAANEHLERRVRERTLELERTQSELVSTARRAGMAEIATNVLHNVGNILNSVNVSAGMAVTLLRRSRVESLSRAMELMSAHTGDLGQFLQSDEKGRLLPAYLTGLAASLEQEQREMAAELGHLVKSIDHIKDVVATQQSYAGGIPVIEPVRVCELAEDALRIQGGALARHRVQVVREFGEVPQLRLDRARLLQILVNLISNAKNAMDGDGADPAKRLVLRIAAHDARLRVSVQDDGVGIPPDHLTRIFSHGFTTRPDGHGFGLHSSALAAREMGGTLVASSDGPGRGATFILELPIDSQAVAA
jgi:signal transduction histidine kinase